MTNEELTHCIEQIADVLRIQSETLKTLSKQLDTGNKIFKEIKLTFDKLFYAVNDNRRRIEYNEVNKLKS